MDMIRQAVRIASAAALVIVLAVPLLAAELKIGVANDITAIDPHYHNLRSNIGVARHIFDSLTQMDENQLLKPGLALSWRPVKGTSWEFKLRQGVTFHDGSPFTADDVIYSMRRVISLPDSPFPFNSHVAKIIGMESVDPHTVRFRTAKPYPLLPTDLAGVSIMSRKASEGKSTEQINKGDGAAGTGPYKYGEWAPGKNVVLVRNDAYWGEPEPWDKVTFITIRDGARRTAALVEGKVDLIGRVPIDEMAALRKNRKVTVARGVSNRLIYLHLDSQRDESPFVKSQGENPLKDVRVRKAISLAINRQAIVQRILEGMARPAGQLLPKGFFGHDPQLKPDSHNPKEALALLTRAKAAKGLGLTLHCPNDRYVNDGKVCQAIAQMLTRAGLPTKAETMPKSVFFPRASRLEFSMMLVGWGAVSGEGSYPLRALLATFKPGAGLGAANRGRYSNSKLDAALSMAMITVNDDQREELLREATGIAMRDYGIIPLYFQFGLWATSKEIVYQPRTDEHTLAMNARPK